MNPRCDTLLDEIKKKGKLSEDDLLQLCEEYDLFPNEVDWITDKALECHCLALSDYRTPKAVFNWDICIKSLLNAQMKIIRFLRWSLSKS